NLRSDSQAHRQSNYTCAARNVELSLAAFEETVGILQLLRSEPRWCSDERQFDLATVRVPAQDKRSSLRFFQIEHDRLMRKQHRWNLAIGSVQSTRPLRARPRPVVNACQLNGVQHATYCRVRVVEHCAVVFFQMFRS